MPDDILLNKSQIIRRCLARVTEEYADESAHLEQPTRQDSIVINYNAPANRPLTSRCIWLLNAL